MLSAVKPAESGFADRSAERFRVLVVAGQIGNGGQGSPVREVGGSANPHRFAGNAEKSEVEQTVRMPGRVGHGQSAGQGEVQFDAARGSVEAVNGDLVRDAAGGIEIELAGIAAGVWKGTGHCR